MTSTTGNWKVFFFIWKLKYQLVSEPHKNIQRKRVNISQEAKQALLYNLKEEQVKSAFSYLWQILVKSYLYHILVGFLLVAGGQIRGATSYDDVMDLRWTWHCLRFLTQSLAHQSERKSIPEFTIHIEADALTIIMFSIVNCNPSSCEFFRWKKNSFSFFHTQTL